MTDEQQSPRPKITADPESLYSEDFARERARKSRRGSLVCGLLSTGLGVCVIYDAIIAFRNGTEMTIGRYDRWPPFIGGPFGVLALLVGLWLLAGLIFRRDGK